MTGFCVIFLLIFCQSPKILCGIFPPVALMAVPFVSPLEILL